MNRRAQHVLKAKAKNTDLPYCDEIRYDTNGYVADPPSGHRLSDALVFLIIAQNTVAARYRHARWPADFDCAGDIYADRWPMGHPVILWAFGIPFVAIYADYYIMSRTSCRPYIWLLNKKPGHLSDQGMTGLLNCIDIIDRNQHFGSEDVRSEVGGARKVESKVEVISK